MTWKEYVEYARKCDYNKIGCTPPLVLMYVFVVFLALCSCTTTRYVPVETVRTERVTVHDSIYVETVIRDSTTVKEKGDTVLIEHWSTKWRDKWRDRWRDSIRVDSVQVPYPVERKLTKWESFCIDYGKLMVGATAAAILGIVFVLVRWIRRKCQMKA